MLCYSDYKSLKYCQFPTTSDEEYLGQFTEFFNAKEADTRKYVFI